MSQTDLATKVGIAPAQISRYESGKNVPRSAVMTSLAEALGVDVEWLSGGAEPVAAVEQGAVEAVVEPKKEKSKSADAEGVIADQARQIWELRCRLAATNMALFTALLVIEHGGEEDEETLLGLKRLMQRNAPFISSLMNEETLKLVSQISVEDEMQEIREHLAKQKAGKPKP